MITMLMMQSTADATAGLAKAGVHFEDQGGMLVAGNMRFCTVDGSGEPKPVSNVNSTLAQLGLEGWELVSHTLGPKYDVWYLKRPLEDK